LKTTISEPETWKKVIDVEVPEDDYQKAFGEKLKKYRREIKMPGFRPGKVPEKLIQQRFGPSIRAEVIDEIVNKSYQDACTEHKIGPVSLPKVLDLKSDEGQPLSFSIETEVDPEIEITGYQKLKIKASPKKIKDSDVDSALQNLLERFAEFKDVDRSVKKGDYIRFEYRKVIIDGEERTDMKNPTYPVEVGGEGSLKDFHKGIIGHNADEEVTVTVKFPKDYSESNVAGKSGEFTIKLLAVQEKVLPEINEEFLKKLGDIADEAALRDKIRQDIEAEEMKRAKEEAHEKAIDALIKENDFAVPPARIDQVIDYRIEEAKKYLQPGQPEPDRDQMKVQLHDSTVRFIKRQRIVDAVATGEKIKPTQAEVDDEIRRIAAMYQQDFDTLKQALRKNGTTMRIRDEIRERKTLDYLIGEYTPETKE
jgi:trigger factor